VLKSNISKKKAGIQELDQEYRPNQEQTELQSSNGSLFAEQ
jgi:hypothetical protein